MLIVDGQLHLAEGFIRQAVGRWEHDGIDVRFRRERKQHCGGSPGALAIRSKRSMPSDHHRGADPSRCLGRCSYLAGAGAHHLLDLNRISQIRTGAFFWILMRL
jgi:hypothetical protein